ncbi:carboxylate/amino acid/amine transporter [Hartmannibacter diazotrophicus]|uniref:Carboxylate/amino acid/amine transporter n=1 Tax=Hartmannibacter diazotrophicus TaxID=1482074 RepID=A0A2C9D139_9HYPH|nr:DMT family transporter [Hartmannibacter diazotrophicus]SON54087.1 carboxylate/amino acid/amine transporter [Hartmannibacter diazotrophicus]
MTITAAAPRHRDAILLGILLMLVGDFMFALNDALGKWLVGSYGVGQVLFLRSLAGVAVILPMVLKAGPTSVLRLERPRLQVARAVLSTAEIVLFYAAVASLPLAYVMTIYLSAPIWVAALSPLMLGEAVGWRRWSAIVVGFGGVIVALQPSADTFSLATLLALAGSLAFALMIILSRQLRATPDVAIVFWQTVGALAAGIVLVPFDWAPASGRDIALMGLLGVVALLAHLLINRSLKLAPAAAVAPIQYTLLVWAVVFGYFIFGDVPQLSTAVGAAIIVAAGLFIFERQKKKGTLTKETVKTPPG